MSSSRAGRSSGNAITLLLTGDVMLGRGIDQILPHPADPCLREPVVTSATTYVELAEAASGSIPYPVDFSYVWGDALGDIAERPDLRVINLETAITTCPHPEPKGINYRMNPLNIGCLTTAKIDCCVLANNHVLDWGENGLRDTLESLRTAGIARAGAGRDRREAAAPAITPLPGGGRALIFGFGSPTAGIPPSWTAGDGRPGVNLLADYSEQTVAEISAMVGAVRKSGDLTIASIHWGPNWGYAIPAEQRRFAHRMIDMAQFDVVHGHSSHHAKAIEIYRDKLILYGCGDFLNDYEGITGYEAFRDDLGVAYFARYSGKDRNLTDLTLIPFHIRKFRLNRASSGDVAWLQATLDRECSPFGTRIEHADGNALRALPI